MITVYTNNFYKACYEQVRKCFGRDLSLLKFINYLVRKLRMVTDLLNALHDNLTDQQNLWEALEKYCSYDQSKRLNFNDACRQLA